MRVMQNERVPVGHEATLGTSVYLPDGGGRFPAVLMRTPYGREGFAPRAAKLVEAGLAVVAQDTRGRGNSDGPAFPLEFEQHDAQTTLDWIANASWCNGRIGMSGASYDGAAQWFAAATGHPALRCIAPMVAPGDCIGQWVYPGGCFALANAVRWTQTWYAGRAVNKAPDAAWERRWRSLSIESIGRLCDGLSPALQRWAAHDAHDAYWRQLNVDAHRRRWAIPIFHVAGWWDHVSRQHFLCMEDAPNMASPEQKLIVGPWGHNASTRPGSDNQVAYGDWSFTDAARLDTPALALRFLLHYLLDQDSGWANQPAVNLFVMGENRWRTFEAWPPPEARTVCWYLAGDSHGSERQGRLTRAIPDEAGEHVYRYDPANPCPTRGGPIYWGLQERYGCGPVDCSDVLRRPDVLSFIGDPLSKPMTVIGPIRARLRVSIDREDTDLFGRFCVQRPDGRIFPLTVGALRLRFRKDWSSPEPMTPGKVARVELDLGQTAYRFAAGERLVLLVTSSDFPRSLRHHNTMEPAWSQAAPVPVHVSLHHGGPAELSALEITILSG